MISFGGDSSAFPAKPFYFWTIGNNHRKKRTRSSIQNKNCIQHISLCGCVHAHELFVNRFKISAKLCAVSISAVQLSHKILAERN